jgi:hypothetical protein
MINFVIDARLELIIDAKTIRFIEIVSFFGVILSLLFSSLIFYLVVKFVQKDITYTLCYLIVFINTLCSLGLNMISFNSLLIPIISGVVTVLFVLFVKLGIQRKAKLIFTLLLCLNTLMSVLLFLIGGDVIV